MLTFEITIFIVAIFYFSCTLLLRLLIPLKNKEQERCKKLSISCYLILILLFITPSCKLSMVTPAPRANGLLYLNDAMPKI